ncbi:MAG: phage holin family protein [Microvirga sp.]|nr:phage holin family protein [Microvirga sp.]
MNHDRSSERAAGLDALFAEAASAATELARGEMALLRRELASNTQRFAGGLVAAVVAAFCGLIALALACLALVEWLAPIMESRALAALVVAAIALALAIPCMLFARARLSADILDPRRTRYSLAAAGSQLRRSLRR